MKAIGRLKYSVVNDCYICSSHKTRSRGYVQISVDGKLVPGHRYVYEIIHGDISKELVVRHKCDNRECINPDHLEVGSHKDNSMDMVGRRRCLEMGDHQNTHLTEQDVLDIYSYKDTVRGSREFIAKKLAEKFLVSRRTIFNVWRRETWNNLWVNAHE